MPLRDHFRPPLDTKASWEGFHGGWPMMIVLELGKKLPPRYVAAPRVHLGTFAEIDVSTYEEDGSTNLDRSGAGGRSDDDGGTATAVWSPPEATLSIVTDLPAQDEYEVRVYDTHRGRRLVAAIEIVSPGNKDRPENRRAFVAKCTALLQEQVSVVVVDLVTVRHFNFYASLLELIGHGDPSLGAEPPGIYAVACRTARRDRRWLVETWYRGLALNQSLPTMPLWLADDLAVPVDLEASYEATCRALRLVGAE